MTNDDHTGTDVPAREKGTHSPSAARAATLQPRPTSRVKPVLLMALLSVVAVVAAIGFYRLVPSPSQPDDQRSYTTMPTIGYSGSATSTGAISPAWASGVETAWRIPFPSTKYGPRAHTTVEGTTLYALFEDPDHSTHRVTAAAFDISSEQPRELWRTTGTLPNSLGRPSFVSYEDQFIVGSIVIDKASGAQSSAPWEGSEALAAVDGVVVACDNKRACSGWTQEASSWVRQWETTTASQRGMSTFTRLTYPDTPVIGTGEHESVVLPVDSQTHAAQLLDPRTGQVTDVGSVSPFRDRQNNVMSFVITSDGILALNDDLFVTYDSDGFITGTQSYKQMKRIPTRDGRLPTTAELGDFLNGAHPAWSNATVTAPAKAAAGFPFSLTVTPSDGRPAFTLDPGNNDQHYYVSTFWPSEVRASTDTSVVYIESADHANRGNRFLFDTASGQGHGSDEFRDAEDLSWVFDDLTIGVTIDGIVAFTPKAS
ncbi:hypothetical protein [Kytococcus sedentarius]|uniref:hypothetical protein n=1 Tax=Kytococcus sedentarius TaxID=1276 RepID=UPI00065FA9DA|nr:hypothetical protein [Kytococcus sedentarius]